MHIYYEISKAEIEQVKLKIRQKISEGLSLDDAIRHGVKYICKLIDKNLPKHKQKLLQNAASKFVKDFKVQKEHLIDPMKLLNLKSQNHHR